ncbi:MAG: hypothetical protein KAS36_06930 [Anaerolineales bacterium]|nr:hypothetical protein [Anaerolineales bacterium]
MASITVTVEVLVNGAGVIEGDTVEVEVWKEVLEDAGLARSPVALQPTSNKKDSQIENKRTAVCKKHLWS